MYRNITVNGKNYKYTVGKSHTKIAGVGVFLNSEIGELREIEELCECCGEPLSSLYKDHVDRTIVNVTPKHISKKIKALFGTEQDTFDALTNKS